jgi:hypothetical protein
MSSINIGGGGLIGLLWGVDFGKRLEIEHVNRAHEVNSKLENH